MFGMVFRPAVSAQSIPSVIAIDMKCERTEAMAEQNPFGQFGSCFGQ